MSNEESSSTITSSTSHVTLIYDNFQYETFTANSSNCCSFFPCFEARPSPVHHGLPSSSPSAWEMLHQTATAEGKWWAGPVSGLKKAREWSEIIAGPKWKTFIRRFNKSGNTKTTSIGSGKFQYDALSYSLNFDNGQGHNCNFGDDNIYFPDFSSRFASINFSKIEITTSA